METVEIVSPDIVIIKMYSSKTANQRQSVWDLLIQYNVTIPGQWCNPALWDWEPEQQPRGVDPGRPHHLRRGHHGEETTWWALCLQILSSDIQTRVDPRLSLIRLRHNAEATNLRIRNLRLEDAGIDGILYNVRTWTLLQTSHIIQRQKSCSLYYIHINSPALTPWLNWKTKKLKLCPGGTLS